MAKTNLVIVESPAKAKTIGKYLGTGYKVKACMGHLRDLPKSTMGVDIEGGFIPNYQPIKGKEEVIADLSRAAKSSGTVYLATDPDREGEAISWHLKELLELPDEKTKRVTFNEITKKVVNDSIASPRALDQNLIDAQQARRILDRIVGYQLSPLLWRKIRRGLSAGRVQSVATRIVVDREEEIRAFVPEEYWTLDAQLSRIGEPGRFTARFYGNTKKKLELKNEGEVDAVSEAVKQSPFTVVSVKRADKQRSPAPPFTTSTLQQEASRKLNMTPRRTMSVAQQLYEGVDISGEGTVGLITYMRTDSLRISEEALREAKTLILGRYGEAYYPPSTRRFKTKAGAQDAHEAIRPSNVNLSPEDVKKDLTSEQYRLYKLIWSRFLASQMANAVYDSVAVEVESAGYRFRANHSALRFAGYTAVYEEGQDEEKEDKASALPDLKEGETVALAGLAKEQHFTQPPVRYTEASLIRAMEEKGIGRPSTYAPTISTILDREYVAKEGKYLRSTPLGEVVTGLMKQKFTDIVDTEFTARMEESLDGVEEGKRDWKAILEEFYRGFDASMKKAETDLNGERIRVPDEVTDETCDLCGRKLVIKSGRFGRFLACPGYPECKFTKPIVVEMPGKCPLCGGRILKKTSKKGFAYYGCEKNPECSFMTWDVPVKETCPECGHTLFKKSGKGFKRPFCINETCPNFLPEDKRGYRRKTEGAEKNAGQGETEPKEAAKTRSAGAKKAAGSKAKAAKKTAGKTAAGTKGKAAGKTEAKAAPKAKGKTASAPKKTAKKSGKAGGENG
ncbi:type I DNA topoisomerase [Papillibacter cinnamivorans]|uniref:DNA topoisomerase 1 n=1 Tax=Papillibacter cinnamivorans DSM 12816 TaxID=1122930 RepID=A0A1W1ZEZ9_9FIRM|nr:type I DNA topoisomerase [Papillibacter cinnamivorans]SMC46792.1 DNA topoisomerase-1 [Papillibacter cinnamivorans DSM 12816]